MTQKEIKVPFNHPRAKKIFWIFLLLIGFLLGFFNSFFPSNPIRIAVILLYLIGFAVILCTMEYTWAKQTGAYVNHLNEGLLYAEDPDLYIEKLNALLANENLFQDVYHLNLSVAYCEKREYEKADEELQQVHAQHLSPNDRVVLLIDKAIVAFYLGDYDRFLELRNSIGLLPENLFPNDPSVLPSITIMEDLVNGKIDEAHSKLDEAMKTCSGKLSVRNLKELEESFDRFR